MARAHHGETLVAAGLFAGGVTAFTLFASRTGVSMAEGLAASTVFALLFMPCLVLIALGLGVLALHGTRGSLVASALVFGLGFGTAYPTFVAYVMHDVDARRRGAAFGAVLLAFDTGVGSGSTAAGWLIQRFGFSAAFGTAAALSAIALPYFLLVDRKLR